MGDTTEYITPTRLKQDRGWTDRLVQAYLGEPDATRPNPRYRHAGAPMRLYRVDRVTAAESSERFQAELRRTARRRISAAKAVGTRTRRMVEEIERAEITIVAGKSRDEIRRLAAATHGGNYAGDPGPFAWSDSTAVNCIRHCLTNYECLWAVCNRGETGREAYELLRERVDDLIAETYPEYFGGETDARH